MREKKAQSKQKQSPCECVYEEVEYVAIGRIKFLPRFRRHAAVPFRLLPTAQALSWRCLRALWIAPPVHRPPL